MLLQSETNLELFETQAEKLQAICTQLELLLKQWHSLDNQMKDIEKAQEEPRPTSCSILPFKRPNQT